MQTIAQALGADRAREQTLAWSAATKASILPCSARSLACAPRLVCESRIRLVSLAMVGPMQAEGALTIPTAVM